MNYSKEMCNDGIMLDPRLRNYIQYKKAYDKDGIETGVPLEKMFQISKEDIKTIKQFMKGKRDFYTMNTLGNSQNFVKPSKKKFEDTDEKFRKDPHFEKLELKLKNNRDAVLQRDNYTKIRKKYNMYSDNELTDRNTLNVKYENKVRTPYDSSSKMRSNSNSRSNSRTNSFLLDSNDSILDNDLKYDNPNRVLNEKRSNMVYHNEPKISMNQRLRFSQDDRMPKENLNYKSNKSSIMHSDRYTPSSNFNKSSLRNMDADNDMRFGLNSRGGKSIGYKNAFSHQFQFIDDDIQHPDHVVNDRGVPTRLYNKSRQKYKRDIYR